MLKEKKTISKARNSENGFRIHLNYKNAAVEDDTLPQICPEERVDHKSCYYEARSKGKTEAKQPQNNQCIEQDLRVTT